MLATFAKLSVLEDSLTELTVGVPEVIPYETTTITNSLAAEVFQVKAWFPVDAEVMWNVAKPAVLS
jgi:hypothetical protein